MKSKEELKQLKQEVEALNKKLTELTEEELKQVTGGVKGPRDLSDSHCPDCGYNFGPILYCDEGPSTEFCPFCDKTVYVVKW